MKQFLSVLVFLSFFSAIAQVEIDQPVLLTGSDGNRSMQNLEAPVNGTDAVNKDYVDNAVAASGGGSSKPTAISNESSLMSFGDAVQYCETLSEGGNDDWRLPTLQEALYFTKTTVSTDYLWTLSESPGLDHAVNQNFISVRLNDGKWRNGGASSFMFLGRGASASNFTNTTWVTVATFNAMTAGNTFLPTTIYLSTYDNCSGGITRSRLVFNVSSGISVTTQEYTSSGCGSSVNLNNVSIPILPGGTPLTSIEIQTKRDSGTGYGNVNMSISGWETNYAQLDGNNLKARCVR
ncbi:MAG: hypothetical protein IT223_07690 [Crocinitomicaceae bacterium]|nr:hypothetical protein [Crocinitomicaceae bacterium]